MEIKDVISSQLSRGLELANQLKNKLLHCHPAHHHQLILLDKIVSSYDNALTLLDPNRTLLSSTDRFQLKDRRRRQGQADSDDSDHKHVFRKRKLSETWSQQVRVLSSSKELDGPSSDGHTWRKYGQKHILGTLHPRAYYRCAYKNTQGCLATKQVQRTDENPSLFQVNYKGNHSCIQVRYGHTFKEHEEEEGKESPRNVKQKIIGFERGHSTEPGLEERLPSPSFPSSLLESNHMETNFFSDGTEAGSFNVSRWEAGFMPSLATYGSCFSEPLGLILSGASSESDFGETVFDKTPSTLKDLDVSTVDLTRFESEFIDYIHGFK